MKVKAIYKLYFLVKAQYAHTCIIIVISYKKGRGGADKSLARPTSRCRRTELCRLKERSVHVPNCKPFLVTEAERKHVRRHARFQ